MTLNEIILTEYVSDLKKRFDNSSEGDKKQIIEIASQRTDASVTPKFKGEAVRLQSPSNEVGTYLLMPQIAAEYVVGFHDTCDLSAKRILKAGFKEKMMGSGVCFHVGGTFDRGSFYAKRSAGNIIEGMLELMFAHPEIKHLDGDAFEAVRDGCIEKTFNSYYTIWGVDCPADINILGVTIEALVPIAQNIDHTNGRLVNGAFKGYEIQVAVLPSDNVTFVGLPYHLDLSMSGLSLLQICKSYPDFRSYVTDCIRKNRQLSAVQKA